VGGGTGSGIRSPIRAAVRARSAVANPCDSTDTNQANGRASTKVISSPAVTARSETTRLNVTVLITSAVRL
jgi:hypothetical protein